MRILNLIRYKNLIILIFSQLLAYQFLISDSCFVFEPDPRLFLLIVASVLIAASANIINDYFDINIDRINKPEQVVVGRGIKKQLVIIICTLLNLITLGIGIYLSKTLLLIFILTLLLTYLYSAFLKRICVVGNFVVSLLLALPIFIVWIYKPQGSLILICSYSFFAFFTGIIREIAKDCEDIAGDKAGNCKTIPILLGIQKTKILLKTLITGLILSLVVFVSYLIAEKYILTSIYILIFVGGFSVMILSKVKYTNTSKDFSGLSRSIKIIIVLGLLSMIFVCF